MITEFYKEYMSEIYARAGSKEDFAEEQFTEEMCEFLVEQAIIENYDSCFFAKTRQGIRVDAWNYNKDKQELCLLIADFNVDEEIHTLSQSDVETIFKRAERFFKKAADSSFYIELEESLPIYSVARDISENINQITKVKFILITNSLLSDRFKGFESRKVEGYNAVYDIWDINRRARIEESGREKEDIIIDFTSFVPGGIKYLEAYTGSESTKSYLLAFPGYMIAQIYDEYGERLLEQNVRTFLQFRGNVNKGIRNTIKNEPDMFFAYNNGLTVTAEETEVSKGRMLKVKNLQIVNGGQTTASIFMSKLQDKNIIDLEKVFVQVKMTVIEESVVDEVVPLISRFANTQNKVSNSDFFSNHPFHKRIEEFSRRILAPASDGAFSETHWFYERARGQYANIQAKMTQSAKKKFLIQNPKNQKFTKTDLAKYEYSFDQHPHFVSKGAQWNFGKFAESISGRGDELGRWDRDEEQFNELYYKKLIVKAILFKFLDKNIMRQTWYGGYKANIVTYTIAKFMNLIGQENKHLDYLGIWKNQKLAEEIETQLLILAEFINELINDTHENVTQYCKKADCWKKIKEANFELNNQVREILLDSDKIQLQKKSAKKDQKQLNRINTQIEVVNKGQRYWTALNSWAIKTNYFTDKQLSILRSTSNFNKSLPSEKQCREILIIEDIAIEEGFYFKSRKFN